MVTSHAGGLRFSIAFFTTREEVHRAVEVKNARSFGTGIGLLADLYDLMGEDHWLEGGLKLAGAMVDVYMDGDLPRGSSKTEIYESQLGPGNLLYALTRLGLLAKDKDSAPGADYTNR